MNRVLLLLCAAAGSMLSGCVTVYQPLTSLQRPTVVDPRDANFAGERILIRCVAGDYVGPADAQRLCNRLQALFANQGADVDTVVPYRGAGALAPEEKSEGRPDLVIEVKSRLLREENPPFLWVVSVLTLTIVPAVSEYTVAQDISIRDSSGFQLASDTLQARFVRYFGVGLWGVNKGLDLLVRPESEHLTGDAPNQDFSKDFYRQLSQLAFNAHVRSSVLKGFEESPDVPGAATPAPKGP